MSENLFSVIHTWVNRWQNWQHPEAAGLQEDAPLRAELFSAEQMVRHGKVLARSHKLAKRTYPDRLLKRLEDNERVLVRCCQLLQASTQTQQLPPAGEWLLDNYYLVEEQIHLIRQSLPKKYGRGLPRLSNANQQGVPRVYDIALEAIAHGDGHWDADSFSGFISAYQTLSDLSLGELWALPIMLRLALIENLRRIALCQIDDVQQISLAIVWAERLLSVAQAPSDQQLQAVAEMAVAQLPLTCGFIAEFTRRLQGKGAALTLATDWLTLRLQEQGKTIESAVQMQAQLQATRQLSVSNSISSLRHLDEMNWPEFVETMSVTEQILRTDPCGVYAQMDFTTRDTYRHVIERLARSGRDKYSEPVVARKVLEQAQQATSRYAADDRRTHVGYYLIGDGLAAVETMFGVRRGVRATLRQTIKKYALHVYVSAVIVEAMLPVWLMAYVSSPVHWLLQAVLGVSGLIAFSQLALSLINEVLTRQVRPAHLPKVDYSQGLPPECRSLVAVPMLLRSKAQIDEAVAALEVRYLANPDAYLHFALLTDFTDASQQIMPEDGDLLAHAKQHILNLNQRINSDSRSSVFFLLHRDRSWNEGEQCWMGYERKRGKLAALNAFLLGRDADAFDSVTGRRAVLSNVRYVITLDLDTQLPLDAARQLIGTLAHPLNQAVYDPICQRVITGYAILQPRIAEVIPEQGPNRYTQICGAESGLDPYTRTVSDVYQDLFGEGSFIGKGIYDLAVFERVLSDRWPDNQVLSHDLLEGCYARSGLISDITLYEPPVENYLVDVARRSRWIRGDWQLLPWLRRKLRNTQGQYEHNTLSALSQWKLFDNLRRSMVPAATLTLLISSVLLCSPAVVTILLAVLLVGSPLVALLLDVAVMPAEISLYQYWRLSVKQMFSRLRQRSLELLLLPFDAYYQTKAIMTAIWRMWVSHAGLLEWTTAEVAQQNAKTQASVFYHRMWFSVVCALVIPAAVLWLAPHNVLMALLLGVGWLIVPALLAYISQPVTRKNRQFDASQQTYLRQLSRETWGFFETFVNADENYLPPDNFQEVPEPVVAHRTSPTNIGLSLLANLTAFDFGYITRHNLLQRCTLTLNTLDQLGRYRGHFYN
ncbi:MAG: cyclic beta 1-2 glucan synthetase, partial [Plesiomonas sp.]